MFLEPRILNESRRARLILNVFNHVMVRLLILCRSSLPQIRAVSSIPNFSHRWTPMKHNLITCEQFVNLFKG